MPKVAVVLGTRPEIIKMSPVVRALESASIQHFILHTGQHYSYEMDRIFFDQLRLPHPKYNLNVGSGTHGEETGKMLIGIERVLMSERPSAVLVQGDTNSVLAGAIAASKLRMPVGHVEAGLRSWDRSMPEEINRILADHVSEYLFAPTEAARKNLLREGVAGCRISVTGNTVVDAIQQHLHLAQEIDIKLKFDVERYFLVTMHREENVDSLERLTRLISSLEQLSERFGIQVIYPIHPRTRKRLEQFGISPSVGLRLTDPVDYLTFLRLESQADLILTDSGGVQEEACILAVPCVTLRDNTERPETIEVGANVLAGTDPEKILKYAEEMLARKRSWGNPFGDGKSSLRIVKSIIGAREPPFSK